MTKRDRLALKVGYEAPMRELVTEIHINAPPERVWAVFTANHEWSAWNPFIIKSEGAFVAGQKVTNTMHMIGQKPMTFSPRVLVADPARELRWLGRLVMPGIFDGEHYFKLEATSGGTRFVQGEKFSGLLAGLLNLADARASFSQLNEALKKRVEG